ncbi:hypothetical protein ASG31_04420 [Chryseobacterium sp. Leaf404]|uniref:hypothetical protein n=1 Tax=unclassified Chryseobacterium TaxID=2593645 RepID=UPI0006F1E97E|nr:MULTISPECIES: hypothetical protein [unclassified Chryseobacterium]KQT17987.1 hypothetical protein ASG31_04420 [Chryseobacterium sp. Leaf404]
MKSRIFLAVLYFYALFFSVCRTVRFPNDWAMAHWLMDYHSGIIKRGLAGEIFGFLFTKTELNITIVSAVVLVVLYLAVLMIALKESFRKKIQPLAVLFYLTFFISQYVVFSAHLIGYLDHLIFLMAILTVFLIRKKKVFIASLIAGLSVFIHEISFFLLIPVSVFALILSEIQAREFSLKKLMEGMMVRKMFIFLMLPVASLVSVFYLQEYHLRLNHSQIFSSLKDSGFISESAADSVASGFTKSFAYQWEAQNPHFFQRILMSTCTVFYGIPIAFMLLIIFKIFNLRKNLTLFFATVFICLCPLFLHAIAYDTYRIWTFPLMIVFLLFWILNSSETESLNFEKFPKSEFIIFIISLLLMVFTPLHLFDNEVENVSFFNKMIVLLQIIFITLFGVKKISDLKKPEIK